MDRDEVLANRTVLIRDLTSNGCSFIKVQIIDSTRLIAGADFGGTWLSAASLAAHAP
jgi:hypothetical protein